MKTRIKHLLTVLALVFLFLPSTPWAQEKADDETKAADKKEEKKEKTSVVDSEVEVGLYYLSDDSFRFGKYSGLTDDGAYS
jgi:hypothetical protein